MGIHNAPRLHRSSLFSWLSRFCPVHCPVWPRGGTITKVDSFHWAQERPQSCHNLDMLGAPIRFTHAIVVKKNQGVAGCLLQLTWP
eukprot:scaffold626_cov337-Pavlova_lutheri.AAC.35